MQPSLPTARQAPARHSPSQEALSAMQTEALSPDPSLSSSTASPSAQPVSTRSHLLVPHLPTATQSLCLLRVTGQGYHTAGVKPCKRKRYDREHAVGSSSKVQVPNLCCLWVSRWQVGISYLEIYNEAGYDLLVPAVDTRVVEDLPRVHIMEDEDGRLHMRNLSLYTVASKEEALNLV